MEILGKRTLRVIIIFLVLFVGGIFAGILLTLALFFISNNDSSIPGHVKSNRVSRYQYQEISPFSNTLGISHINRILSNDEFISYRNPKSGSTIVISNFGSSHYECSGHCFCSEPRRIVSSSTAFSRPLLLLISALSTSLAFKIAETVFQDQCALQFSDYTSCEEQNIKYVVKSCEKPKESEEDPPQGEKKVKFTCEGHCLPIQRTLKKKKSIEDQEDFIEETGGCESLITSGTISIDESEKADVVFARDYLNGYCYRFGRKRNWFITKNKRAFAQFRRNMCFGVDKKELENGVEKFKNIECFQEIPKKGGTPKNREFKQQTLF